LSGPVNRFQNQLLEHLPVAFCSCDTEGNITEFNHHATDLWGSEPGASARFHGAARLLDVKGKLLSQEQSPIACALRTRKPQRNTELMIERPDSRRITVLSNAAPQFDADGNLIGAMEVFHDITERRYVEEARRVADRLAASARVANQVAQQIKKPLGSLTSLLDILRKETSLSAEARSYTELIQQELSRFDRIAKEIVHLSMAA